ncbi:SdrD B-like domain-containing protein, partial [Schaalia canis]
LPAGTSYVVTVTKLPRGLAPTVEADDDDAAKDSSAKTGIATSGDLTVDGASDVTLDFGYVHGKVSVGDRVWFDTNKNGLQDDGEPGVEGATLTIARTDGKPVVHVDDVDKADAPVVAPVVTQADGLYVFENLPILPEGVKYKVSVQVPAKYAPTEAGVGADRAKDSSTGEAEAEELAVDGAEDKTLDFGFVSARVPVGDFVWFDANKDGKQDDGEPGIEGVKLTVLGPDGQPVAVDADGQPYKSEVVTDKAGKYLFENLPVLASDTERYTVKVVEIGAEYTPTVTRDEVSTPGLGVDNDSSKGQASTVKPLTVDKRVDDTLDFGFVKSTVSVGDFVWFDSNGNGRQDAGEPGIAGVELTLTGPDGKSVTDVDGKAVPVVTTDKDGKYVFENLPVLKDGHKYTVTVSKAPAGYVATKPNATGDVSNDSSSGSVSSVSLVKHGDKDLTLDFGFVKVKDPVPGKVAKTGADTALAGGVAVLVMLLGAAGVLARRRATQ